MPADQWDPKYPKDRPWPPWHDDYEKARAQIYRADSPWHPAFRAVADAYRAGAFDGLQDIYYEVCDSWTQLHIVWTLVCKPMFLQEEATWPSYAKAVYDAVPGECLEDVGELLGLPYAWVTQAGESPATDEARAARRRIQAFKSTALFIAGLMNGELPHPDEPAAFTEDANKDHKPAVGGMKGIDRLVDERVARAVARRLRPLFQRLDTFERGLLQR